VVEPFSEFAFQNLEVISQELDDLRKQLRPTPGTALVAASDWQTGADRGIISRIYCLL